MNIIDVTKENLEQEHICCALANNKDEQVIAKKQWMEGRFQEGLVFKKGDVRGKCFIEYLPIENAWVPVLGEDYMYINCLWVSGKFQGQGIAKHLLNECIKDSKEKGKKGIAILSSSKKKPYLADPEFLTHHGFLLADKAEPYFELRYLPFEEGQDRPRFMELANGSEGRDGGFVLYYTHQCPFTAKYVPLIEGIAREKGVDFQAVRITTKEEAKQGKAIFSSYSLFYQGKFLTHEILTEKKFETLLKKLPV